MCLSEQSVSQSERDSEDKVGTMITHRIHKSCNHSLVRQTNGPLGTGGREGNTERQIREREGERD